MPPEEELAFIKDPDKWPQWPLLPMKNRNRGWGDPLHTGLLLDWGKLDKTDIRPTVVIANLFMFDPHSVPGLLGETECTQPPYTVEEYKSFEDMQAAGWVVD